MIYFYFHAKVPSRKKLRILVNKMAGDVKERIKASLANSREVSVTTDIWSSKGCKNSYLGMTTHSLNTKTKKKDNYRISCRLFDCKHSGKNIAKMTKRILSEFSIEHKINRILSDNASNAIKSVKDLNNLGEGEENEQFEDDADASDGSDSDSESECDEVSEEVEEDREEEEVQELADELDEAEVEFTEAFKEAKIERGRCVVHTLQLPICRVIGNKKASFGRVLRKTKKFVVKYTRSSKAKAILRKAGFKLRLKGWVKTRWWSDYEMVARIVQAGESPGNPLTEMSDKMDWPMEILDRDLTELKGYLAIMKPFVEMGNWLGAEKLSTMHLVFPMITELLEQLEDNIRQKNYASFCKSLRDEVKKYFKFMLDQFYLDFDPLYVTATYKLALSEEMKVIAVKNLKKLSKLKENIGIMEGQEAVIELVVEEREPEEVVET
jgi:hypothetical protein